MAAAAAKPTTTVRERAWRYLRALHPPVATAAEIAAACVSEDGDERSALRNVRYYLRELTAAGYVREAGRETPAYRGDRGRKRWRLVRDTGREAPLPSRRHGLVHDRNTGESHPMGGRDG